MSLMKDSAIALQSTRALHMLLTETMCVLLCSVLPDPPSSNDHSTFFRGGSDAAGNIAAAIHEWKRSHQPAEHHT